MSHQVLSIKFPLSLVAKRFIQTIGLMGLKRTKRETEREGKQKTKRNEQLSALKRQSKHSR